MRNYIVLTIIFAAVLALSLGKGVNAQSANIKSWQIIDVSIPKEATLAVSVSPGNAGATLNMLLNPSINKFASAPLDAIKARNDRIAKEKADKLAKIEAEKQRAAEIAAQANLVRQSEVVAPVYNPSSVQSIIIHWANIYGVSSQWMLNVANCESSFDPNNSYMGHHGVYQFDDATWSEYYPQAGAGSNVWDAESNIRTAIWMFAHGMSSRWTCA